MKKRTTPERARAKKRAGNPAPEPRSPTAASPAYDDVIRNLVEVSSDWYYWEQDEQFRFTRLSGSIFDRAGIDTKPYLGKKLWELGWAPGKDATWEPHRAVLEAYAPFTDFLLKYATSSGDVRYANSAGQPVFDDRGRFRGYRGVAHDVTRRIWNDRLLMIERAVAQVLAQATRISDAMPKIIRAICENMNWSCGAFWRIDKSGRALHFIEAWGTGAPGVDDFLAATSALSPLAVDAERFLHRACAGAVPVWVADINQEPSFRRAADAARAGLHGAFALPIKAGTQLIGALEFYGSVIDRSGAELLQDSMSIGSGLGRFCERKQAEDALLRFRAAIDVSGDPIYLTDRATMQFIDVNDTAVRMTGYSREELLKLGPQDISLSPRAEIERVYDQVIAAAGDILTTESVRHTKSGEARNVEHRRCALHIDGRWIIVTISHDITDRKRAEEANARLARMFAALSATNEAILRARSVEDLYQRACNAAVVGGKFLTTAVLLPGTEAGSTRVAASAGRGERPLFDTSLFVEAGAPEGRGLVATAFDTRTACVSDDYLKDARTRKWRAAAREAGVAAGAAVPLLRRDQVIGAVLFYSNEKRAFDEEIVKLLERMAENVVFALDNFAHEAERKNAEERIQYLATHDGLTDLPNRVMFNELLVMAIEGAKRYERRFAVLFIDLDRFKVVNDTLGHEGGDQLLKEMSERFRHCLRASDVVARLGGDEFVVLAQEAGESAQITAVARKILSAALKPVSIFGHECRVTASIGIATYPADAQDAATLMKNADIAMYLAKEEGKNNFQFYSKDIKTRALERMTLETNLRRALERNEFSLHYQAKMDSKTGCINGVEALLRWNNPELGSVSPMQFIPIAEETGLIIPIGRWVLHNACRQNVAWQRAGLPAICIAVNLSMRQFTDPALLTDIAAAVKEAGMAPELLELELTESMVMHNTGRAIKVLTALKAMGVRLAIDDFGTGYSSLAQIKHFPIDTLKVDRSFIREIPRVAEDRAITEAIIAMGKTLSLTVVAEGVETKEQAQFLREHACDEMQGYYFGKPIAAEEFAALLRGQTAAPS